MSLAGQHAYLILQLYCVLTIRLYGTNPVCSYHGLLGLDQGRLEAMKPGELWSDLLFSLAKAVPLILHGALWVLPHDAAQLLVVPVSDFVTKQGLFVNQVQNAELMLEDLLQTLVTEITKFALFRFWIWLTNVGEPKQTVGTIDGVKDFPTSAQRRSTVKLSIYKEPGIIFTRPSDDLEAAL